MRYLFLMLFIFPVTQLLEAQHIYNFELNDTEGKLRTYSELKGQKITVIDFWATWCKPCVNSIPKLVELSENFPDEQVSFIGISIDSPRNLGKIKPFSQSLGITYPVLLDTNQDVTREYNISVIPTLLIVNSNSEIVAVHEGFAPGDEQELKSEIEQLLYETD